MSKFQAEFLIVEYMCISLVDILLAQKKESVGNAHEQHQPKQATDAAFPDRCSIFGTCKFQIKDIV